MSSTDTTSGLQLGIFQDFERADTAVAQLVRLGVDEERISVVCSERLPTLSTGIEQEVEGSVAERRAPAALTGGAIGSLVGGFSTAAGIAASGGTALLFAGPLLGAVAAGVAGGFVGAMVSRGLEPDAADFYDQALRAGSILVAVEPTDDADQPSPERVRQLLEMHARRAPELDGS